MLAPPGIGVKPTRAVVSRARSSSASGLKRAICFCRLRSRISPGIEDTHGLAQTLDQVTALSAFQRRDTGVLSLRVDDKRDPAR
jgi:hypothetical protein